MNFTIPEFGDKQELFDWLKQNKHLLMKQKKSAIKLAGGFGISIPREEYMKPLASKELGIISMSPNTLELKTVINATNIIDSHKDLHIPKIWNKSVRENKDPLHLQEHKMEYDFVIADGPNEVKTYVTSMRWKDLGWDYEGKTELLMHALSLKGRNQKMETRYRANEVKYHSVGMRYVNILFCVDSEEKWWREEKDNFDKYIEMAVNPQVAKEDGYFWSVLEAAEVEGSAVVRGSCPTTPTIEITEAGKTTSETGEPAPTTPRARKGLFASVGSKL